MNLAQNFWSRLDMGYGLIPECRSAIPRLPSAYLTQLFFDLIAHNRNMLRYLVGTYHGYGSQIQ